MFEAMKKSIEKQNELLEEILEKGSLESVLKDVNPTEEALSIVNWVKKEILKDRSRTLLWVAELIKTEYNKPDGLPFIRIINQIAKEMISNELNILHGEVSELKEEIIDEGKC